MSTLEIIMIVFVSLVAFFIFAPLFFIIIVVFIEENLKNWKEVIRTLKGLTK